MNYFKKTNKILSKEELEFYKKRALEIKDEITLLSKKPNNKNVSKMLKLSKEFKSIHKKLKIHLKKLKELEKEC